MCPDRRNRDEAGDPDLALAAEVYGARRYDHGSAPGQYPMLGPNALGEDQGSVPDPAEDEGAAAAPPCFLCGSGERCARSQLVGALRDDARNRHVPLTELEFEVMNYLNAHTGKVASRIALESEVWGYDYHGGSNVVDAVVKSLRKKLGERASLIETVHGRGYRLRHQ